MTMKSMNGHFYFLVTFIVFLYSCGNEKGPEPCGCNVLTDMVSQDTVYVLPWTVRSVNRLNYCLDDQIPFQLLLKAENAMTNYCNPDSVFYTITKFEEIVIQSLTEIPNEDYEIFKSTLNHFSSQYEEEKHLIRQNTRPLIYSPYIEIGNNIPRPLIVKQYLEESFELNIDSIQMASTGLDFEIFDSLEFRSIAVKNSFWINFYEKYSEFNGFHSFTNAAILDDEALIGYQFAYASEGAEVYLVYLKKIDSEWIVIEIDLIYIS